MVEETLVQAKPATSEAADQVSIQIEGAALTTAESQQEQNSPPPLRLSVLQEQEQHSVAPDRMKRWPNDPSMAVANSLGRPSLPSVPEDHGGSRAVAGWG